MHDNIAYCPPTLILTLTLSVTCPMSYYTIQLQEWHVHCPISAQIGLVITNRVREFCYGFDYDENCVRIAIRTPH